jgi:hypothetical protein
MIGVRYTVPVQASWSAFDFLENKTRHSKRRRRRRRRSCNYLKATYPGSKPATLVKKRIKFALTE